MLRAAFATIIVKGTLRAEQPGGHPYLRLTEACRRRLRGLSGLCNAYIWNYPRENSLLHTLVVVATASWQPTLLKSVESTDTSFIMEGHGYCGSPANIQLITTKISSPPVPANRMKLQW